MKRKIIYLLTALLLIFSMFSISGCGIVILSGILEGGSIDDTELLESSDTRSSDSNMGTSAKQTAGVREENTTASDNTPKKSNIGDYRVEIVSSRVGKDYEENDVIIVKFSFTNNSDDAVSFSYAFDCCAYQNGIELDESLGYSDDISISYSEKYKDIKKGATIYVEIAYELRDLVGNVEVEVSSFEYEYRDSKVTKVFSFR